MAGFRSLPPIPFGVSASSARPGVRSMVAFWMGGATAPPEEPEEELRVGGLVRRHISEIEEDNIVIQAIISWTLING